MVHKKKFESITPITPEILPNATLITILNSDAPLRRIIDNITNAQKIVIINKDKNISNNIKTVPSMNALAMCPLKNLFLMALETARLCFLATPCFLASLLNFLMFAKLVLVKRIIRVTIKRPKIVEIVSASCKKK